MDYLVRQICPSLELTVEGRIEVRIGAGMQPITIELKLSELLELANKLKFALLDRKRAQANRELKSKLIQYRDLLQEINFICMQVTAWAEISSEVNRDFDLDLLFFSAKGYGYDVVPAVSRDPDGNIISVPMIVTEPRLKSEEISHQIAVKILKLRSEIYEVISDNSVLHFLEGRPDLAKLVYRHYWARGELLNIEEQYDLLDAREGGEDRLQLFLRIITLVEKETKKLLPMLNKEIELL